MMILTTREGGPVWPPYYGYMPFAMHNGKVVGAEPQGLMLLTILQKLLPVQLRRLLDFILTEFVVAAVFQRIR